MEQIENTRRRKINPKTICQHNRNITKFYEWVGTEVDKNPDILSCSVGNLFDDIIYNAFDDKDELMEELLRSIVKCYRCKDIAYDILPPKILKIYYTLYLKKYKWGRVYDNGNMQIKTTNDITLKNGFDLHRKFLEAIDYGRKIANKRFPQNY